MVSPASRMSFLSVFSAHFTDSRSTLTAGGSITINSSDPFSTPLINPNLLSEPVDLAFLREGIRSSRRFIAAQAWDGYFLEALNTAETDDELDAYIRENGVSFFHPVATAAMGEFGVVDVNLKVKGVNGLRIVDGSVIVSGFTYL